MHRASFSRFVKPSKSVRKGVLTALILFTLSLAPLTPLASFAPPSHSGFTGFLSAPQAMAAVTQGTTLTMPNNSLGLVGHWTFDGKDMLRNVADTSGQGNTGYMVAAATSSQVTPGPLGQALKFNGTSQYVVNTSPSGMPDIGGVMTLSLWVKYASTASRRIALALPLGDGSGDGNSVDIELTFADSTKIGAIQWGGGTIVSATAPAVNVWHLISYVQTGNGVNLYIDGALAATAGNPTQSGAVGLIRIGSFNSSYPDPYWNGSIDDVRLYNRALSAAEIKQLYNQGTGSHQNHNPVGSGLIGYWTFDSPTIKGSTVIDNSGSGNTGTLVAGPSVVMGKINQALKFNGTTQYVKIPLVSSQINNFTFAFWLKVDVTSDTRGGIFFNGSGSNGYGFFAGSSDGGNTTTFHFLAQSVYWQNTSIGWTQGKWHHIVGSLNSSNVWQLYKDGVLVFTSAPRANLNTPTVNTLLGSEDGASSVTHNLDDPRIYNRALSAAEVTQLYVQGTGTHQNVTLTPPNLASGLVGHWTFDGKDMIGNVRDSSGQGNTGYMVAAATSSQVTPGPLGQALKFNGTTQYVNVGNTSSLTFTTNSFSISIWAYLQTSSSLQTVIGKTSLSGPGANDYDILNRNGTYSFRVFPAVGAYEISDGNNQTGKWAHIVAVRDSGNTGKLYVNDVLVSSTADAGNTITNAYDFHIGHNGFNFNGTIDDVRVYNRALSQAEITQLYNLGH